MKIFKEKGISYLFQTIEQDILVYVRQLSEKTLLENDVNELSKKSSAKFRIDSNFELIEDSVTSKIKMEPISGNMLPPTVFAQRDKTYYFATVRYTFTVTGNSELFKYQPSYQSKISDYDGELAQNSLSVIIWTKYSNENLSEDVEKTVKREILNALDFINDNKLKLKDEIEKFNETIESKLLDLLAKRKDLIKDRLDREDRLNPFK
jgi:hypothetical protein